MGNKNALKHGRYTAQTIQSRRLFLAVARIAGQTLQEWDEGQQTQTNLAEHPARTLRD